MGVFLTVADGGALVAQVVAERVGDFRVEEIEQMLTVIDQVHANAQAGEQAAVFAADHAGAVDDHIARRVLHFQDGVGVVDTRVIKVHVRRAVRPRAGGDQNVAGAQGPLAAGLVVHPHFTGAFDTALAVKQTHPVAHVKIGAHLHLAVHHFAGTLNQILPAHLARADQPAQQRVALRAHHLAHLVAQRLGGNRAPVGAVAAHLVVTVDHGDAQAPFGRLHGGGFPGRAAAQHH